jgi:L-lysine 6-transaminase
MTNLYEAIHPYVPPIDPDSPIINFEKSNGSYLFDEKIGKSVIDFSSHYASLPIGYNHPAFADPDYEKQLLKVSKIKIANLDILCDDWLDFFTTFRRVVGVDGFDKYFFVEGGALAVENALKTAFDWKVRRNLRKGLGERGHEVLHFREAFHGRSGYTLSLTNTADPNKTKYFAKFDWPRVLNPKMRFPLEGKNLELTLADEEASKAQIRAIMEEKAADIACILVEPIQGEGGDNHFRTEYFQFLRDMCDQYDCLLVYDEVQTGMGMCGTKWAWETIGVKPDVFSFAKKAQVGGIIAGARVLEEPENVFNVPSRISSTWGASLTDMIRCKKYLEIVEQENLIENAKVKGVEILDKLQGIAARIGRIDNIRGKGLFVAFDIDKPEQRGEILGSLYQQGLMVLPSGDQSLRFRPQLNVTSEVIDEALEILEKTLS